MTETPAGTPVGVADPYAHVERCDHLTDDGRCRLAAERPGTDPAFAAERAAESYRCPAADPDGEWGWADCPHFRSRATETECARCGLGERRDAHSGARPLLEEHHLSYAPGSHPANVVGPASGADTDGDGAESDGEGGETALGHEVTVALCRWCHAKIHNSWAAIDDDVAPDPEAVAAREQRRSRELEEATFRTAAERREDR